MPAGRPHTLNDFNRSQILALFSTGLGVEAVADYVGCAPRTIHREMVRNADFRQKARKARMDAHVDCVNQLRIAASKNWRAAAWLLERMDPSGFARKDPKMIHPQFLNSLIERLHEGINRTVSDSESRDRACNIIRLVIEASIRNLDVGTCQMSFPKQPENLALPEPADNLPPRRIVSEISQATVENPPSPDVNSSNSVIPPIAIEPSFPEAAASPL